MCGSSSRNTSSPSNRAGIMLLVALLAAPGAGAAPLLLDEHFADFAGNGLRPGGAGGTLDSLVWRVEGASDGASAFGDTRLAGDLARGRSAGGERSGGLYAFELPGGRRGPGVQPTGSDFTPGALTRRIANSAAGAVHALAAALELWVLNDGSRATRLRTSVRALPHGPWLEVPGLGLVTAQAPDALGWSQWPLSAALPLDALAHGASMLLRLELDDAGGTGARDEIALAAVQVSGLLRAGAAPAPLAAPAPAGLLAGALGLALLLGRAQRLREGNGAERRR